MLAKERKKERMSVLHHTGACEPASNNEVSLMNLEVSFLQVCVGGDSPFPNKTPEGQPESVLCYERHNSMYLI